MVDKIGSEERLTAIHVGEGAVLTRGRALGESFASETHDETCNYMGDAPAVAINWLVGLHWDGPTETQEEVNNLGFQVL